MYKKCALITYAYHDTYALGVKKVYSCPFRCYLQYLFNDVPGEREQWSSFSASGPPVGVEVQQTIGQTVWRREKQISYTHTLILPYCYTHIPSYCHTLILPYTHTAILSYCHTLILPYTHTAIHSYCHTLILPYCYTHTLILPYTHTAIHTYCHTLILPYTHTTIINNIARLTTYIE